MTPFSSIPPIWQFVIFAVVLVLLASWDKTAKFALSIAAAVLLLQLIAMSKQGHAL